MPDLDQTQKVENAQPDAVDHEVDHEADEEHLSGPAQPLGSQALHALHEDATYLLHRYHPIHERLEPDSKVKEHMRKKLEGLVGELEGLESLHNEHYKDIDGVPQLGEEEGDGEEEGSEEGGEEGEEESEEGTEEPEGGGGGEEEESEAGNEETEADSHEEELPPPEESAEAMQKKEKALKKKTKALQSRRKANEDAEDKEEEADEEVNVNEPEANEEEAQEMEMEPHEKEQIQGARNYLDEVSQTKNFSDAHRMHAFHHHMNLGQIGSKSVGGALVGGGLGAAVGGLPGAVAGGIAGSMYGNEEKGFPEAEGADSQAEVNEPTSNAQDMPPHIQAVMGAHDFLGRLSQETAFGDSHRHEAAYHSKALGDAVDQMSEEDMEAEVNAPDSNSQDMPSGDGDMVGEIDEKSLRELQSVFNSVGKQMAQEGAKQAEQIKDLQHRLRNVHKLQPV